jgi:hypothetical protein
MPRGHKNEINAKDIKQLTAVGRHRVGDNLFLIVAPGGSKQWAYRWKERGKSKQIAIPKKGGRLATYTEAKAMADEYSRLLRSGVSPRKALRPVETIKTFGECCKDAMDTKAWKRDRTGLQWFRSLEMYSQPVWKMPVNDVDVDDVLAWKRERRRAGLPPPYPWVRRGVA